MGDCLFMWIDSYFDTYSIAIKAHFVSNVKITREKYEFMVRLIKE